MLFCCFKTSLELCKINFRRNYLQIYQLVPCLCKESMYPEYKAAFLNQLLTKIFCPGTCLVIFFFFSSANYLPSDRCSQRDFMLVCIVSLCLSLWANKSWPLSIFTLTSTLITNCMRTACKITVLDYQLVLKST